MKRIVLLKARNKYLNRPGDGGGDGGGDEQDGFLQQKQGIDYSILYFVPDVIEALA